MTIESITAPSYELPDFALRRLNLADSSIGANILSFSDAFFGSPERMLNPLPPVFYPARYDDNGKWMDGWESKRRRGPGHDWAIVRLAMPGRIHGIDLDTSFFTGNYPLAVSVEAGYSSKPEPDTEVFWREIVPATAMRGNSHHFIPVTDTGVFTHLRVNLIPDGGLARLRVYGDVHRVGRKITSEERINLLALELGGREVAWNDSHYGTPMNLLKPNRGRDMGDGWETRRRREPGHDWCILRMGFPGTVDTIEIDTAHFKGNFPERFSLQGALMPEAPAASIVAQSQFWQTLLPEQALSADSIHEFASNLILPHGPINHIRLNIFPDGGVSRMRLWGFRHLPQKTDPDE